MIFYSAEALAMLALAEGTASHAKSVKDRDRLARERARAERKRQKRHRR